VKRRRAQLGDCIRGHGHPSCSTREGAVEERAGDRQSFGRSCGGGYTTNVLTTSSELASGTGSELGSGTNGRVSLGGSGRRIVGFTLRRDKEKVKRIMLGRMERIKTSRWVGVVDNLCLRGKVGRVGGEP
jgi:hypothetical protein